MLRDRVSSFWALEVACLGGSNPPEPPFVPAPAWRHVPRGTVGPGALFLFLLGYSNHKPPPLPYSLYEGRCIRCPGFTLWQSTSLKRTRRSSAVSLEVLARSTKGEQIRN